MEGNEASDQSHTGEHLFHVLDQVLRAIGPTRFKAITSDNTGNTSLARLKAPSDVYLSGFILDPRFRGANILRDLNPLVMQKLKIPARDGSGKSMKADLSGAEPSLPDSLRRTGTFLLGMLCAQYQDLKMPIAGLSAQEANGLLKQQVVKYVKGVYPFDRPFHDTDHAGEWWKNLDKDQLNDAQPLAKLARAIFEVLPNSMVDERMASTMKWYNSRLRSRQRVATLVRMTKVRQWYRDNTKGTARPFRPTVRFRDMKETVFGANHINKKDKDAESEDRISETEEDANEDGDDEDNSEDDCGEDETDNNESRGKFSDTKLELEDTIDINSPILLDPLADEDRAPDLNRWKEKGKGNGKKGGSRVELKVSDLDLGDEELWEM
ncbi:hypothetical protein ACEPAI_4605 [Sanghuangporus weigelae]